MRFSALVATLLAILAASAIITQARDASGDQPASCGCAIAAAAVAGRPGSSRPGMSSPPTAPMHAPWRSRFPAIPTRIGSCFSAMTTFWLIRGFYEASDAMWGPDGRGNGERPVEVICYEIIERDGFTD